MAHRGLMRGTPLRTIALLLADRQDLIYEASLGAGGAAGGMLSPTGSAGPTTGVSPSGMYGHQQGPAGAGYNNRPGAAAGASAGGGAGMMQSAGSIGGGAGGLFSPSGSAGAAGSGGAFGFFSPSAGPQGDALLMHWRENLAVMAANRTAGGVDAMMSMGDLLLSQQGQVGFCRGVGGRG